MGNALLDALTYFGESVEKPGRAVRGVLGGRPREALAVTPFSDSIGLTDRNDRVTGQDLINKWGLASGGGMVDTALGLGVDVLTDPTTYIGAGLGVRAGLRGARAASPLVEGMANASDDVLAIGGPGLKSLRDRFGMAIVNPADRSVDTVGRTFFTGGKGRLVDRSTDVLTSDPRYRGVYNHGRKIGATYDEIGGVPGMHGTRRHETMHGLINTARDTGDSSPLGFMGRAAAMFPHAYDKSAEGYKRALGLLLEEAAAHAASGRGIVGQAKGMKPFFMDPRKVDFYSNQIDEMSPLVAQLYRNMRYVPYMVGAGGIGSAGALLI